MSSVLQWKQEPASPLSDYDEAALFDATVYDATSFENFDVKIDVKVDDDLDHYVTFETKAEAASHILENLENLMDLDELIIGEPFLLDEKILPLLDEVEPPRAVPVPVTNTNDTHYLLKEFENVYDVVEFCHDTLTPPQSPPSQPMLTMLEPLLQYPETKKGFLSEACTQMNFGLALSAPQSDIARELAVVDELVRTRVEDMQWSSSPGSPDSSSSSCSNFGDCSSDDPEWMPEPVELYPEEKAPPSKTSRKRSRPNSKNGFEDKKVRKKEQNKNAATRYRLKKKAEIEEILFEEKGLFDKNTELGTKVTDLNREIKYLKGLMRDLFKAKGLIS